MAGEFTITDGSVEYKHTKPLAEYDNKAPMVRLTFTIAEGSDPLAVTEKVMGMAMVVVEKAIATNVTITQEPKQVAGVETGRMVNKTPTVEEVPTATTDAAAIVDEEPPTPAGPTPEPEPEEKKLTLKDDVQPLAQKVSAKLRKEFGNIGALRDVFEACGSTGKNLTGMPEDQWKKFMVDAKKLLEE